MVIKAFVILLIVSVTVKVESTMPFCEKLCECPDGKIETGITVNCEYINIIENHLYNSTYWQDDKNQIYNIKKFIARKVGLKKLLTQFPTSNLTELDLSYNSIMEIGKAVFENLEEMKILILSHNNLDRLDPEAFKGFRMDSADYPLKSLSVLKLNYNNFHTLDHNLFRHIPNIKEFYVDHNPLRIIDSSTLAIFSDLYSLEVLDISYCQLTELPDHFMHTPKNLVQLDLSGNSFSSVPETLRESHALKTLYFNNNPVVNLTEQNGFPKIPTLKVLHLSYMENLINIENASLSNLINLEELHITDNLKLSYIDGAALSSIEEGAENEVWPPIKELYLQNNKLTSLDFHLLPRWDHLSWLDIRDNSWTCECENQWMIEELMLAYKRINESMAREVECAAPIEMKEKTLYELHQSKSKMRCLDLYGNEPEKDAALLVGILAGLLIGIPIVLFAIYAYQRRFFGYFDTSPAAYSRRFYSRTYSDDL